MCWSSSVFLRASNTFLLPLIGVLYPVFVSEKPMSVLQLDKVLFTNYYFSS